MEESSVSIPKSKPELFSSHLASCNRLADASSLWYFRSLMLFL